MSELFYYIGVIYIIHYLKAVYDSCIDVKKFRNKTMKEVEEIQEHINNGDIQALKKGTKKNLLMALVGFGSVVLCYWWMIYGYFYAPESKFFLGLIIISIAFISTTLIKAVKIIGNSNMIGEIRKGNVAGGIKSAMVEIDNIYQMIFNVVNRLAKVGIAVYILYNHFYIII